MNVLKAMDASMAAPVGTVLIVDDEMMVTSSLQTMLLLETAHRVHCFNDPREALREAPRLQPDVVVSDFSMPGMDGIRFLGRIKALLPEATLILLTGYADKENAIAAINSVGIYRYLEKPWDNEDLKISIANGLERSRLLSDLRRTISELTDARASLEQNNQHLEAMVEARTADWRAAWRTLSSIVDNTTDGIVTLNGSLEPTLINPAAERWMRRVEELRDADLTALPLEHLIRLPSGSGSARHSSGLRGLFEGSFFHRTQDVFIGDIPLEAGIAPLRRSSGEDSLEDKADGFVVVLRDITERREIERLRDDFVSTLTHDLRTPLLAAIQTLGFFADGSLGVLTERQRALIGMLIQSQQDMLALVNVLLDVYRYEAGHQCLILDQVNVWELLEVVCRELESLAHSRRQTLSLEPFQPSVFEASVDWLVQGDKRELKRVFMNLIGNAIHYTPPEGRIAVALSLQRDESVDLAKAPWMLQVCVSDNGRGIPASDIPQLFQRFAQGTSRQRSSGSGLGLYLSRQIIEAHQGRIWVESEEDRGSRFYIRLPLGLHRASLSSESLCQPPLKEESC